MDKNIIKNHLSKRFLSEESTPGISVTDKAKKESDKINKAGVAAIGKDVSAYEKSLKKEDPNMGKMPINKYNYTDDAEKTYHEEMEILNGQEMIEYTSEPGAEFKKRAEEAIEGSSRMGNAIGGNAEETWGASKDSFGKDLIKRVRDSSKKRADAEIQTYGMGDVQIPTGNKVQTATTAVAAGKPKGDTTKAMQSASDKPKTKVVKENNNNNNNPQIKESMKRLKFNKNGDKPFKGVNLTQKLGHALKLIPEGYKVDNKEFEMTDGNVTCRVRWEGNLNEGNAVVLIASDKTLVNEDMNRMKVLMGYKSEETLGLVKGNARLNENKIFGDIWNKSKKLLGESEDIEDADVIDGTAESLDDAVNHAPEAKKHVEGSVATEKKTEAPAPKVGNWEEIKKKSADASKDVESGKPTSMATDKAKTVAPAKAVNENELGDDDDAEEKTDDWEKPETDDDSAEDKEPTSKDIKNEVPALDNDNDEDDIAPKVPMAPKGGVSATILFSPSTGEYWLKKGDASTKVPDEYLAIAADKTKKGVERASMILAAMQEKADSGIEGGEDELDEYGDEHPISTADAVSGMKPGKPMAERMNSDAIGGDDDMNTGK